LRALTAIDATKALTDDECDTLRKCIDRGFAERRIVIGEKTGIEKSIPICAEVSNVSGTGPITHFVRDPIVSFSLSRKRAPRVMKSVRACGYTKAMLSQIG
jgi:hypothetical protein